MRWCHRGLIHHLPSARAQGLNGHKSPYLPCKGSGQYRNGDLIRVRQCKEHFPDPPQLPYLLNALLPFYRARPPRPISKYYPNRRPNTTPPAHIYSMHPAAYLCNDIHYLRGQAGASLHNMQDLIGQGYPQGYPMALTPRTDKDSPRPYACIAFHDCILKFGEKLLR